MRVSYKKLWKKMKHKYMKKKDLMQRAGISANIIAKMGREEPISMESVGRICAVFHCSVDEILEIDLSTIDKPREEKGNGGQQHLI